MSVLHTVCMSFSFSEVIYGRESLETLENLSRMIFTTLEKQNTREREEFFHHHRRRLIILHILYLFFAYQSSS